MRQRAEIRNLLKPIIPLFHYFIIPICIFLFLVPSLVYGGEGLTLKEAYLLASKGYEGIKIIEEDLFQAREDEAKARAVFFPELKVENTLTRYSEAREASGYAAQPETANDFSLKLTQPLTTGGKERSVLRQSRLNARGAEQSLLFAKETLFLNVADAYYSVLKAESDMTIRKAALKRVEEQKKASTIRYEIGEVTKAVLLRVEADVAQAEADLIKAEKTLIFFKERLKRLTGIKGDFSLKEPFPVDLPSQDLDRLLSIAMDKRDDYKRLKLEEEASKEGVIFARGSYLPTVKAEGVYRHSDQDPSSDSLISDNLYGALTVTVPIFEGGLRRAELSQARSKVRQAELKLLNLKKEIALEVRESYLKVDALRTNVESFKRQQKFAEENYNMVFTRYREGLDTVVELVDASATLIAAHENLNNTVFDLELARIELLYRTGVLLESFGLN